MSETVKSSGTYDHFTKVFYASHEHDPEALASAKAVNDMFNQCLINLGVGDPSQLPQEIREYLEREAEEVLKMGAHHD